MKITPRQLARAWVELADGKEGKELEQTAKQFVDWMSETQQLPKWRDVARSVDQVWKEKYGVANVSVASAHPLSAKAIKAIEKAAKGATVVATVDDGLIAGARIRIDDRIIDATALGTLEALRTHLAE